MSDDELALLRGVAASPDDDTPRLVFADWLEERGLGVRAEFIRLQCEIAEKERLPRAVINRYVYLWERQQELLDDHLPELLGPLAGVLPDDNPVGFHRGFVAEITASVTWFLEDAGRVLADLLPLPRIRVSAVAHRFAPFFASPHAGAVAEVTMFRLPNRADTIPHQATGFPDTPALVAAAPRLVRLEVLDLESMGLGDFGCRLLQPLDIPTLVELDLSNNQISDVGLADLLAAPVLRRVQRLILGGNPIGNQGAIELADRLGMNNRLRHLNMRFTNVGPPGQSALLARFGGRVDLF